MMDRVVVFLGRFVQRAAESLPLAAYLLLLGACLHYGYERVAPQYQSDVWNIAGAVARIGLLVALLMYRNGLTLFVGAWWVAEELLVIGCSTAWVMAPWERVAGLGQCSGLLHHDLGRVGILAVSILALAIARRQPD